MRRSGHIHQRSTGPWATAWPPIPPAASGEQAAEEELWRLLRTVDTGEHVDSAA
jgi:hypothetical protein